MYGVPTDLPLQTFVGDECCQIAVGRFQLQFRFSAAGSISVEGKWALRDSAGVIIDESQEPAIRESYRIHKIIDIPVSHYTINAPMSFTLYFAGGYSLTIYDDPSQPYESFEVNGIIV
jgi:hypothetical protein